jgi:hypothetical protein
MSGETIYPMGTATTGFPPARYNTICPKCETLYKTGDRHACAAPAAYDNHQCPPYLSAGGMEYIDIVEAFLPDKPYRWHALKYLLRCGKKPGQDVVSELRKALFWIEREIAFIEAERVPVVDRSGTAAENYERNGRPGRREDFGEYGDGA